MQEQHDFGIDTSGENSNLFDYATYAAASCATRERAIGGRHSCPAVLVTAPDGMVQCIWSAGLIVPEGMTIGLVT
jgi:hypothetical protein